MYGRSIVLTTLIDLCLAVGTVVCILYGYFGWIAPDDVRTGNPAVAVFVVQVCERTGGIAFEDYSCSYHEAIEE